MLRVGVSYFVTTIKCEKRMRKCLLATAVSLCIAATAACGQGDAFPPLGKRDYDDEQLYESLKERKYVLEYMVYQSIAVYVEQGENRHREEPLPWAAGSIAAGELLGRIADSTLLLVDARSSSAYDGVLRFQTSYPAVVGGKPVGDMSDRLRIELVDSDLRDAGGAKMEPDPGGYVSKNFSPPFEGDDQGIVIFRVPMADGFSAADVAAGSVTVRYSLAGDFRRVEIGKKDLGKPLDFDGAKLTLVEMKGNTAHVKVSGGDDDLTDSWGVVYLNDGVPMAANYSMSYFPAAFYEFARSNPNLGYEDFEREWEPRKEEFMAGGGDLYLIYCFDSPFTSFFIYKPEYVSIEKKITVR